MIAGLTMAAGFCVLIVGVALWSVPAALIVCGAVLFYSGGLEHRRAQTATKEQA